MASTKRKTKTATAHGAGDFYEQAALPSKPSEKHSVLITCQEPGCGGRRWVKPQDVFQVKRCCACQESRRKSKSQGRLPALRQKAELKDRAERVQFYTPKLHIIRFHWASKADLKGPKLARVWP